ncbi:hypothetical protein A2Y85_00770 [candidate division WOR-3 bacterium RBG_13_43_14]|uniref:Uncharacterized protein n=1 Tax=candidate division WOR-3 bacterium RBG_13_43_14 TaxID=1802590 RepID=A0A1F4U3Z4_UNCW3|nr:MAG: hypothetical protein A2Y85_00770 [candidate division WOR-3 bacterium RBG_13_43_14]
MRRNCLFLIITFLLLYCGHKAGPISKDRLKPKLLKVTVFNRTQFQCTFSEPVDTLQINADAFVISAAAETLKILIAYPSLSAAEIMFATEPIQAIEYQISGYVFDTAMNKGNFIKKFKGTNLPDTIKPSVHKYPRGKGFTAIDLIFSEAIDTTRSGFYILPKLEHGVTWLDLRRCSLDPLMDGQWMLDSVSYYLYSSDRVFDLNHNPLKNFLTIFTPDTAYQPFFLEGKATLNDTLLNEGIAVLFRDEAIGIAIISQGIFKFEVRDSLPFQVTVLADQYSGSGEVVIGGENNIELTAKKIDLDDIIH